MSIRVTLDRVLLDRRMSLTELSERVGVTLANLSILKTGKAKAVRAAKMKLGEPDASGRQSPVKTGDTMDVKADMVIKALGFDPEDLPELFGEPALTVNRWGAVRVDYATMETSLSGVYAAGDIVRGASLVVWAIKDGRDAAEAMHRAMKSAEKASKVAAE